MSSGRVHNGVASSYLQQCAVGERVPIFVRHSTFKLPANPASPVVMVGPGTGLAPFRGFIQEREVLLSDKQQLGPAVLFFGCRYAWGNECVMRGGCGCGILGLCGLQEVLQSGV